MGRVWALDCAGQSKMLTELLGCGTMWVAVSVEPLEMLSFAAGLEAAHSPVARRRWFACAGKRGYFGRFQGF